MMQNNKHVNRPAVKPVANEEKKCGCGCDAKCDCGCNKSDLCVATVFSSILVLIGSLVISGTVLSLVKRVERVADVLEGPKAAVEEKAPAKIGDEVFAEYIKKNPTVILDSINAYYEKQRAEHEAQTPTVADKDLVDSILNDKTNHVLGNPKGSFVIIEFFDYNCGYCKMMNKKLPEAIKKSKNIRWVLMDAPIFGDRSELVARYVWAAAKQGKFEAYHTAVVDAEKKDEDALKEIGKNLGLNVTKLAKDANSDAAKAKLASNKEYAKKLNINGVPMFIVDGNIRVGAFSDDQLDDIIKQANEKK